MNHIITNVLLAIFVTAFVTTTMHGLGRAEKADCYKFQTNAMEYPDFYITIYEKEMCDKYGIETYMAIK